MKNISQRILSLLTVCSIALVIGACSSDDNEEVDTTLSAPIGLTLVEATPHTLTFSWNPVDRATGYSCKLIIDATGQSKAIKEVTQTTVVFEGLDEKTTYKFAVQAHNAQKENTSPYSTFLSGTTTEEEPTTPPVSIDFGFPTYENDDLVRAFPGAEGGGMYTTGGRGGKVIRVTNLNDSGTGSLRAAINATGKRTIVFDVDGIIELQSTLEIKNGDVTIAGQTAPGDGICLKNYALVVKTNNVIIRYIRSRMGDEKNNEDDAMWGRFHKDIIIDHCSMSWSTDECSSFYANENFTMQWCVLSESLRVSVHGKGTHGYGAIWGGVNASFHHNLLAHHESRNPRFDGGDVYGIANNPLTNDQRTVDYRNCVVYNFSNYPAYGGEGQKVNFVGNYYKWGPGSELGPGSGGAKKRDYFYLVQGVKGGVDYGCPSIYMGNNTNFFTPDKAGVISDNWKGIKYDKDENKGATEYTKLTTPVAITPSGKPARVTTHTAELAYERVLDYAGASLKRDNVDDRAVNDTRTGKATCMKASNGSENGYIDTPGDVGGWPTYAKGAAKKDTDGDGIPDEWEDMAGLNKNSAADGNEKTLDPTGRYTNLEVYLHWLVKDITNNQVKDGEYIVQ